MIKSIYVSPLNIHGLEKSGANHLIVVENGLTPENWSRLKKLGIPLGISINAFGKDDCPSNPQLQQKLLQKVSRMLEFEPNEIWFDVFRFGGDCTTIEKEKGLSLVHKECEICRRKNRKEIILDMAKRIKETVSKKTRIGMFAIAFKDLDESELSITLGLDYEALGKIFDIFSPMLYHRMLGKSVEYISNYTQWLTERTRKSVLPIIQIKDMPDDLEDKVTEEEIRQACGEAIKSPSLGVSIFYWNHAIEKNKTEIVSQILSSI